MKMVIFIVNRTCIWTTVKLSFYVFEEPIKKLLEGKYGLEVENSKILVFEIAKIECK